MHRSSAIPGLFSGARALVVLAVVLAPRAALARDIEVDPSTLRAALGDLAPGDHVHLARGHYAHFTLSGVVGTAAMPITISGPEDGSAVIDADDEPCCNTIQISSDVSYVVLRSLTVDGRGVDGAFGVAARGTDVHHVTIEDCTFIGHDGSQGTVAISTKTPTAGWVIRGNRIIGAGTGMYLGNSDGTHPFVGALIENNFVYDTIGYGLQIKWQRPHEPVPGAADAPPYTIIRHNVFIKTDRPSSSGDRPTLLVGGFAESGASSDDTHQIYGNLFVHNPREAHIQAAGRVSIHDNVFIDTPETAIRLTDHDLSLRRGWIYSNTIYVSGTGVSVGSASEGTSVIGNLIFAGTAIRGTPTEERDNITATLDDAGRYVVAPGTTLGDIDFRPTGDAARGAPLDLSGFASDVDHDRDFDCSSKGALEVRGAYAGAGTDSGWRLAMEVKPECGASSGPATDGGASTRDAGAASHADGGASDAGRAAGDAATTMRPRGATCSCRVVGRAARGGSGESPIALVSALAVAFTLTIRARSRAHVATSAREA
jgi:hypothetical protein